MSSKSLTKSDLNGVLNNALHKQDIKWDKKLDSALDKQKKEIIRETVSFFQGSIIPLLDKIVARLDSIESIANNHERRIERNEGRLVDHDQRITSLEKTRPSF